MSSRYLGYLLSALATMSAWSPASSQEPTSQPTPAKAVAVPYATAHAKALDAKEEVVNQADDHVQYRVEFNGIKGDRVPAYLYLPKRKADAHPQPAILLQYGSGGNKKTNYIVKICNALQCRGVGD